MCGAVFFSKSWWSFERHQQNDPFVQSTQCYKNGKDSVINMPVSLQSAENFIKKTFIFAIKSSAAPVASLNITAYFPNFCLALLCAIWHDVVSKYVHIYCCTA